MQLWERDPADDGSSFSQSESLKPCRGQSESSRWSLNASRDKWERNTEEIDLIWAAVYINTIYSTETGAVPRICSFTNNIIREMKDLNHFTALFLSSGRMKLLHDLVFLTNNNWKAFFKSNVIFLLLQIYFIAFVIWTSEMFRLFSNYHLNIWDESTWSLSLRCGRDHLTLTDGIMTRIYKIICSTGLICIFSVTLYAVLVPSVCDSHSTGQQTLASTQTCSRTRRSELTLI